MSKPGMSKGNKSPLKKYPSRVIQPTETKNRYSPLETEERLTKNGNTRTDSPNTKVTAKQKAINTATKITYIQNSNDKTESDTFNKGFSYMLFLFVL